MSQNKKPIKKMCVNFELSTYEKLKKIKFISDISYTEFINEAVEEKLERENKRQK